MFAFTLQEESLDSFQQADAKLTHAIRFHRAEGGRAAESNKGPQNSPVNSLEGMQTLG